MTMNMMGMASVTDCALLSVLCVCVCVYARCGSDCRDAERRKDDSNDDNHDNNDDGDDGMRPSKARRIQKR